MHPLDNPVWNALCGPQREFAEFGGLAARIIPDVSRFGAFPEPPGPDHWAAMAQLIGPDGAVILIGDTGTPPEGWRVDYEGTGVQMSGEDLEPWTPDIAAHPIAIDLLPLGEPDAGDMIELVALTRPGPFAPRTWELGGYVGVRSNGRLVAMAGQRLRPPGWCEISAVATHPDYRRQGLGELLVRVVAGRIVARGEVPVLHAAADNADAIRLCERMGFVHRRRVKFMGIQAPADIPE